MPASADDLVLAARAAGVADERVLAAIRDTPRAAYVPPGCVHAACIDGPLPLPHGQVTTQPSLTAVIIAGLGLAGAEQVLEIGTGYGYQAALLARLAARVISIDIWPDIADQARRNLTSQNVANVSVITGDGTEGYPPGAPYDGIIVSAAFPQVPAPLVAQLTRGGRLVQPIGPADPVVIDQPPALRLSQDVDSGVRAGKPGGTSARTGSPRRADTSTGTHT